MKKRTLTLIYITIFLISTTAAFSSYGYIENFEENKISDTKFYPEHNSFKIKNISYKGNYSGGIETNSGEPLIAYSTPFPNGKQPKNFSFYWYETIDSWGGGLKLLDSTNDTVVGFASNNPEWSLHDGDGSTGIYSGDGYQRWIHVTYDFNWSKGTYDYKVKDLQSGTTKTGTRNLGSTKDIKKIEIQNYNSGWGGTTNMYMWFDNIKFGGKFPITIFLNSPSSTKTSSTSTSPTLNITAKSKNNTHYNATFYNAKTNSIIGKATNIANNTPATTTWNNLKQGKIYNWYVKINDGKNNKKSNTYRFSTRQNLKNSLVGYWSFDNEDTKNQTAIDTIGKNNGTISDTGTVTGKKGKIKESYHFDGQNGKVTINNITEELKFKDRFTISLWLNINQTQDWERIISKGTYNQDLDIIAYNGASKYMLRVNGGTDYWRGETTPIPSKEWYFIALTYDTVKGKAKYYINKTLDATANDVPSLKDNTSKWIISERENNGERFYGKLDEIALWEKPLNQTEIEKIYTRSKKGKKYLKTLKNTPITTNFSTIYGSTNFSAVPDITNVSNMTLAKTNSKVKWKNNVNAKNQNYDKNIKLTQGLVSVNSTALDSSINSSATVSLDINSCSDFNIYKSNKPVSSLSELKSQGSIVGDKTGCTSSYCSNLSCNNGELTYDVQHFSSTGADSTSTETVPEFNTYTLLLAVAITILGFYTIRK